MKRGSIRSAVLAGLATFILGPVLGVFLLYAPIAILEVSDLPNAEEAWRRLFPSLHLLPSLLALAVLIALAALMFAGPASLVVGLWVGMSVFFRNQLSYLKAAIIAFVSTIVMMPGWLYLVLPEQDPPFEDPLVTHGGIVILSAILSAIVALILRWLLGRCGIVRPAARPDEERG
ncbi:MAG: hypothetical protein AAGC70_20150 [Pseudomonadota bacterium]